MGVLTAVLAAAVVAASTAGCSGGGDGWKAPDKGQAAVLVRTDDTGDKTSSTVGLGFGSSIDGLAFGSDGQVYGLTSDLVRIDGDRTAHVVLDDQAKGAHGLVAQPGGAFLTGTGATVSSVRADGTVTVLAKAAGNDRTIGAAVPASAAVTAVHFIPGGAAPFGRRPDGSVLLADGDVVWSLKDGRLTRLYQAPASHDTGDPDLVLRGSAVNRSGTAWVAAGSLAHKATVGDLRTITSGGAVATPPLPAKVAGVPEDLAALRLFWVADDGADGVYAHVSGASGDYVLHLRPGGAQLIAAHRGDANKSTGSATCDLPHPVDATKLPCWLPSALAYHAGRLVLGGGTPYVLTIAVS
ncbi:hypothetical protein AB0M29_26580 [Streptomyces sp. NPDC051976]|uniref:hypothetical protein n=1 Tax=Streptomyces sp. NPDC051976 TaxID=3154947 RepID=UPI00343888AA